MADIRFLSLNRPPGIVGLILAAVGLTGFIFGLVYTFNSFGWEGSKAGSFSWLVAGMVTFVLAAACTILGAGLTYYNSIQRKKENKGDLDPVPLFFNFFDLNRVEGGLALPMLGASVITLTNGIIFRVVQSMIFDPKNMDAKRLAQDIKGDSTWCFVLTVALWIGLGICLFVNRYYVMSYEDMPQARKTEEKPKKKEDKKKEDKPKDKKKDTPPPPPPDD